MVRTSVALAFLLASVNAKFQPIGTKDINTSSALGKKILSNARQLEQDDAFNYNWVMDYSIKFQGCHHMSQWNAEAGDDEDVRVATQRLVRFRLCPTDTCSSSDAGGCDAGFGDYVLDMNIFMEAYLEAQMNAEEFACENYRENACDCDDDDQKDDQFDRDDCEYNCYVNGGMDYCIEDENAEAVDLARYAECAQFEAAADDDANNRRRLDEAEEAIYYMGPYCASQGGEILMGLFTDDTCTVFADNSAGKSTYASLSGGEAMPYSSATIIGSDCMTCLEDQEQNDDDAQDEDEVKEGCETIYQSAGKCETYLSIKYPNLNACSYIQGIKILRQDGVVSVSSSQPSKTAGAFIGLFGVALVLLGGYVFYLKSKLDRAKINLEGP